MAKTDLYAVIGDPVSHSLSPAMQNAAFQAAEIPAEYLAVRVKQDALEFFAHDARRKLKGFNITVPHKSAMIPFLDTISKSARLANSVNTVKIHDDGSMYGDSTDGYGLEAALAEVFAFQIQHSSVTLIGCGGVAQALAFHLAEQGAKRLYFLNRTLSKAEDLGRRMKAAYPLVHVECAPINNSPAIAAFLNSSQLAVQCTSLGLRPEDPCPIEPELLPDGILLYDTIYRETKIQSVAHARGISCENGLSMLLHQGAKSFSIWTGMEPDLDAMRCALRDAFRASEEN